MRVKDYAKSIILDPSNRVLLLKRSATDAGRPGEWDFPGGHVELGESPVQGAVRELAEEAGIDVAESELKIIFTATTAYKDTGTSINRYVGLVRITSEQAGSVVLSPEHDEFKWVTIDESLVEFPHPVYGIALAYARDNGLIDNI